jgi:2-dehydro-3-deoxyphosphogluconate aldolase / (4S)-4-hydroxy-2-oxoglutarate aldolase
MEKQQLVIEQIKGKGIVPLFYHDDAGTCVSVAAALYDAGIRCIEFTNRGSNALHNFKKMVAERNSSMPDLLLGIGTISTDEQARSFIEAGADFLVSPFFDKNVCDAAFTNNILWIPGCMTPKEIHIARQAGCSLIKLFPGNVLGPGYMDAVKPLFPGIGFMVTGGVDATEESLQAWFKSGVAAVGIGGKLISAGILLQKDYQALKDKTKILITAIEKIRQ